ncbi:MAG TPA: hypothetical protein VGI39_28440 [Polyangiaceae bacterium]|jgi:hypothetical protein
MPAERIAKYEDWIRVLESRQSELRARRPRYLRLFTAVLLASVLGFVWNPWVGAGTVLTGILVYVFGYYVIAIRLQDYAADLASTRRQLAGLREGAAGSASASGSP